MRVGRDHFHSKRREFRLDGRERQGPIQLNISDDAVRGIGVDQSNGCELALETGLILFRELDQLSQAEAQIFREVRSWHRRRVLGESQSDERKWDKKKAEAVHQMTGARSVKYGTRWAEETPAITRGCNKCCLGSDCCHAQGQTAGHLRPIGALDALRGWILFRRGVSDQRPRADRSSSGAGTFFPADAVVGNVIEKIAEPFAFLTRIAECFPESRADSAVAAPRPSPQLPARSENAVGKNENMLRTTLSIALLISFGASSVLQADPPSHKKKNSSKSSLKIEPATPPLVSGWSYSNGVWTHVDGYKLVNGQVVRSGVQTHKKAPPPPTKAEMDAVMKKKPPVKTAAEIAAEKEAQRQRNLAPRPAPQTGTHL
jgi:hypothetical protein